MPLNTIYFTANYDDIKICKSALDGLKFIENGQYEKTAEYFKTEFDAHLDYIETIEKEWFNCEFSRKRNKLEGSIDISEITGEPTDLIQLLTDTDAYMIKVTVDYDETEGADEYIIDNTELRKEKQKQKKAEQAGKQNDDIIAYCDMENNELRKIVFKAIYSKDIKKIKDIFTSGVDIDQYFEYDEEGLTALMKACSYKKVTKKLIDVIKTLIELDADLNTMDYGETALTCAVEAGNLEVVKMLIDAGARLPQEKQYNYVEKSLYSPVDLNPAEYILEIFTWSTEREGYAKKEKEYAEMLKFFIDHGVSIQNFLENDELYPGLFRTIASQNLINVAKVLIEYGIDCEKHVIHSIKYAIKWGDTEASDLLGNECKELAHKLKEQERGC